MAGGSQIPDNSKIENARRELYLTGMISNATSPKVKNQKISKNFFTDQTKNVSFYTKKNTNIDQTKSQFNIKNQINVSDNHPSPTFSSPVPFNHHTNLNPYT